MKWQDRSFYTQAQNFLVDALCISNSGTHRNLSRAKGCKTAKNEDTAAEGRANCYLFLLIFFYKFRKTLRLGRAQCPPACASNL